MRKLLFLFLCCYQGYVFGQSTPLSEIMDVQGHRGARGLMPENTIPAFIKALELGVKTLEMDAVLSADEQVVVSHDPWINPKICTVVDGESLAVTDTLNMYRLTFEEIKKYDCGSKGNSDFPNQEKLKTYKPLLKDVIRETEKYSIETGRELPLYNIEIKSRPDWDGKFYDSFQHYTDKVVKVIQEEKIQERTYIQSFDPRVLKYLHRKYPDQKLVMLVEEGLIPADRYLQLLGFYPQVYSPEYTLLNEDEVKRFHQYGMKVVPWTVNKETDMNRMIGFGVDGIITDYPDRLLELLK